MDSWTLKATGGAGGLPADEVELRKALAVLLDPAPGGLVQLRRSSCESRLRLPTTDHEAIVAAVLRWNDGAKGIYWSLNPCRPDLDHNMLVADALCRRWLMIDCDPERPKGSNATEVEHEAARLQAVAVHEDLSSLGWPAPVVVDSGNGWHLYYRIELDNDLHARALCSRALVALARLHDTDASKIDTGTFAANAHGKLPGTWARKAEHTDERPHRLCWILDAPDELLVVGPELLAELAGPIPPPRERPWAFRLRTPDRGTQAYGRAALDRECQRVLLAERRNDALNKAAFALYQLVAGGVLEDGLVQSRLLEAATRAGLPEREALLTIASGRRAGLENPRGVPERPAQTPLRLHEPSPSANGKHAEDGAEKHATVIQRACDVPVRRVQWLWPGRIPLGKLTTFAGVGGLGKTFVLLEIAARVTRGLDWPDGSRGTAPGRAIIISGEDDPDDTLVPRLIEVGADLERVTFLAPEALDRYTLCNLEMLDLAWEQSGEGVSFVAIDPPTAYLAGVDDHRNAELRALLSPLKAWAAKRRVALVFNTHVNKGGGVKVEAMMRVMGSVAWVNAVRAAHLFARDPDDDTRRFFVGMKNNLGKERKGLAYRIVETDTLARIEWLGEVDVTADQAMNRDDGRSRKAVATEWLAARFAEKREWPSDELFEQARQDGVSKNAIYEAKDTMRLPRARRVIQPNGDHRYYWWVEDDWEWRPPSKRPTTTTPVQEEDRI
jgi:hypothetical protein